jgi:hypothetical protein
VRNLSAVLVWHRRKGPTMKPTMKLLGSAFALLMSVTSVHAAAYDGSAPLKCRIQAVMMCSDASGCVRGTAESALLPPVMNVDVPDRRLSGDASGRTVKIVSVGHGGGRLVLHGEEIEMAGTAWNVVVDQKSGDLTGAVLTRVGGYLVFGSCAS